MSGRHERIKELLRSLSRKRIDGIAEEWLERCECPLLEGVPPIDIDAVISDDPDFVQWDQEKGLLLSYELPLVVVHCADDPCIPSEYEILLDDQIANLHDAHPDKRFFLGTGLGIAVLFHNLFAELDIRDP